MGIWANSYRERGEFESTSEYLSSLSNVLPVDPVSFALPASVDPIRYDADTESLVIGVSLPQYVSGPRQKVSSSVPTGVPFGRGVTLDHKLAARRTVIGRTFFGRRVRVRVESESEFGVFIAGGFGETHDLTARVPMGRETARVLKPKLGVLLVGRIDARYLPDGIVFSVTSRHEATLDDRVDLSIEKFWLSVVVDDLWLYNIGTGEIVARVPVGHAADDRTEGEYVPIPDLITTVDANLLLERARSLVALGKSEEALVEITSVLEQHRGLAPAYTLRALALEHLGRLAEAVEAVQTAIALDPKMLTPHLVDARLAIRQKDCAAAKRSIDVATGIEATSLEIAPVRELYEAACAGGVIPK